MYFLLRVIIATAYLSLSSADALSRNEVGVQRDGCKARVLATIRSLKNSCVQWFDSSIKPWYHGSNYDYSLQQTARKRIIEVTLSQLPTVICAIISSYNDAPLQQTIRIRSGKLKLYNFDSSTMSPSDVGSSISNPSAIMPYKNHYRIISEEKASSFRSDHSLHVSNIYLTSPTKSRKEGKAINIELTEQYVIHRESSDDRYALAPCRKILILSSYAHATLSLWNLGEESAPRSAIVQHQSTKKSNIISLSIAPSENYLATIHGNNYDSRHTIKVWKFNETGNSTYLSGQTSFGSQASEGVQRLTWASDTHLISFRDNIVTLHIWDLHTVRCITTIKPGLVQEVIAPFDEEYIFIVRPLVFFRNISNHVDVYHRRTGKQQHAITFKEKYEAYAASADGYRLAFVFKDQSTYTSIDLYTANSSPTFHLLKRIPTSLRTIPHMTLIANMLLLKDNYETTIVVVDQD